MREFLEKSKVRKLLDDGWAKGIYPRNDIMLLHKFTEQEIVKPYLDKIRAKIEPKCDRINSLASTLPYTAHREIQELLCEIINMYKAESGGREIDTKTRVEDAYVKGLEDAWECARKIVLPIIEGGLKVSVLEEIFGECTYQSVLRKYSAFEAIQKIKEYEQHKQDKKCENCAKEISAKCVVDGCEFEPKQTDATDMNGGGIKVGDEVEWLICGGGKKVITNIDRYQYRLMNAYGNISYADSLKHYKRTGRTFPQIAEVLKLLRGEEK